MPRVNVSCGESPGNVFASAGPSAGKKWLAEEKVFSSLEKGKARRMRAFSLDERACSVQ
jgi:hypothetical protein